MAAPRALLLDLDGTLIDSLGDMAAAMNRCLAAIGAPTHPVDAYRGFIGHGTHETTRRAAPAGADVDALVSAFKEDYAARALDSTRPFAGLIPALRALGLPMGVLSNKPDAMAIELVAALFPVGMFGPVAGERTGCPRKPAPDGALRIAAALGVPPADVWLIGDTGVDMQTAVAAGMRPVGVSWGFWTPAALLASGAEVIVTAPEHLQQLVEQS